MKTLAKRILASAVILVIVGPIAPQDAWAGGSRTGAHHVQVVHNAAVKYTTPPRVVNAPVAKGFSSQVMSQLSTARGAGKINFNELTINKTTDKASPGLLKSCASGVHYKPATITMRKAGGDSAIAGKPFMRSQVSSAAGNVSPKESVTIDYKKIEWRY